jgi:uncharacterized protein YfiM (DUF2279 family)
MNCPALATCILLLLMPAMPVPASCSDGSSPCDTISKGRLYRTLTFSAAGLAGATLLLNKAWYSKYDRSSFHFYDDRKEWLQMDKAGHFFTSYSISLAGIGLMRNTGIENRKAVWYGGLYGPVFLSVIEVLDGFSAKWGFSAADMAANLAGSSLAVTQEILFDRQVVRVKYSFRESGLASNRPDALGKNLPERMLKDYNGQTYWLSLNLKSLGAQSLPSWLNIGFGYGANGMLGGFSNPQSSDDMLAGISRYRQFYFAPDIDLGSIRTGSEVADKLLRTLNFMKIPSPAIEYNTKNGFRVHLLLF